VFAGVPPVISHAEIPIGRTPTPVAFPIAVESLFIPKIVSAGEV